MLIVLEGCDGAGKTQLANTLASILDAEILHCTAHTANTFEFFSEIIRLGKKKNIIADRFCYGQFVYQDPSERYLTAEDLNDLELKMLHTGAVLVYVTADPCTLKKRLAERRESTSLPVETILRRYEELFDSVSIMPVRTYVTDNTN